MLKTLVIASCLLPSAVICSGATISLNSNFENTPNHAQNWTVGAAISVVDYSLGSNFMVPGPPPIPVGPWGPQIVTNGSPAQTNVQQSVVVAPGLYSANVSALARVFDNGNAPLEASYARLELRADTVTVGTLVVIQSVQLTNDGSLATDWTPWTTLQTTPQLVNVLSTLNVRMVLRADAVDGSWGQSVADAITLNAALVPEPATMGLASIGAVGCAVARRRRHL